MDIAAVKTGIANKVLTVTPKLNAYGYVPDEIVAPCFFTEEVEIEFDRAYGRGLDELMVSAFVLVGAAFDQPSQALLNGYLKGSGASSLKAAIEGPVGVPQTLGGACDDLHVVRVTGYRFYDFSGNKFVGAELTIRVIGSGA